MINREDMLELMRRMTPAWTSITRAAGCYVDRKHIITILSHFVTIGLSFQPAFAILIKSVVIK